MTEVLSVITLSGPGILPSKWCHHCICLWQEFSSGCRQSSLNEGKATQGVHLASMATLYQT